MSVDLIQIDVVLVGPGGAVTGPHEYVCGYNRPQTYFIDVGNPPNSRIRFVIGFPVIPVEAHLTQADATKENDQTLKLVCDADIDISFRQNFRIAVVVES